MTPGELKILKISIVKLASITGRQLDADAITFFADVIAENLTLAEFNYAARRWASTRKAFPAPADLIEFVKPPVVTDDQAQRVVGAIIEAIQRHDYTWPIVKNVGWYKSGSWEGDAKAELGDMGFLIVQRWGGWGTLCESFHAMEEGTFRAQLRDFTESTMRLAKAGHLNTLPNIPAPPRIELLESGTGRPERIDAAGIVESLRLGVGSE